MKRVSSEVKRKLTFLLPLALAAVGIFALCVLVNQPHAYASGQQRRAVSVPLNQGNIVDRYEPNDTFTQSRLIVDSSPVISLTFCTQSGCSPDDPDWYSFNVNPNT